MQKSPFLSVDLDESVWRKVDGEKMGKPGVFWWSVDPTNKKFSSIYQGIIHGEVISYYDNERIDDVVNLAVDTGSGHGVYSFGFSRNNGELVVFLNSNKNPSDDRKVFKIILELLFHLPDLQLKGSLSEKIVQKLFEETDSKLWDRV
ncbi:MAG: hypothetical protein ABH803_03325 [Candidatus Micrarchaeota archaeon]